MFDYPSVVDIAAFVDSQRPAARLEQQAVMVEPGWAPAPALAQQAGGSQRQLCLSSFASRLPSGGPHERDTISRTPLDRWDMSHDTWTVRSLGEAPVDLQSYIPDVDKFDFSCFGISLSEARVIDPQQRLALETSWEALQCYQPGDCSKMGVYVGIQHIDYLHDAKLHMADLSVYLVLSCPLSVVAGRISFLYGLHGPCFSVDTACSASLVALKQAQMAVVANQEPAMVSGVELILSQMNNLAIQRAGMLSPEARCKTLDASADGYVRAEACLLYTSDAADE